MCVNILHQSQAVKVKIVTALLKSVQCFTHSSEFSCKSGGSAVEQWSGLLSQAGLWLCIVSGLQFCAYLYRLIKGDFSHHQSFFNYHYNTHS